jgi:hypothetical protein
MSKLKITHVISNDTTHKNKERRPNGMVQLSLRHATDNRTFKKWVITFSPINYQSLLTCPHELTPRPKESIQLPSLPTLPPSNSIFSLLASKFDNYSASSGEDPDPAIAFNDIQILKQFFFFFTN